MTHPILEPGHIGPLPLRNRILKTATFEGMSPGGRASDDLVRFHADIAANGVALTTVAYGAVHPDGRTFDHQLLVNADAGLRRLTEAVHAEGGAASLQLAHCGGFTKRRGTVPIGPSAAFNAYGLTRGVARVRAMTEADLADVEDAFVTAAQQARDDGFDAIELHCGHGYLLSQFLSPVFNRRGDAWGGDAERRRAYPLRVVRAVRAAVPELAVLVKLNLSDGVPGGATVTDAIDLARDLEASGVDALVPSGGLVQRSAFYLMRGAVPIREMAAAQEDRLMGWSMRLFAPVLVKAWPYTSTFFRAEAEQVRHAVDVPVALLGGVDSAAAMREARRAGFDFVALGRALLADPDLIARIEAGDDFRTRCDQCNQCVAEMDRGGVRCVLP